LNSPFLLIRNHPGYIRDLALNVGYVPQVSQGMGYPVPMFPVADDMTFDLPTFSGTQLSGP
jgi:hypothetical protein